ncbi:MAG: M24 family metallopeptidase [Acidimicrobiia bacterium]
MSLDLERMRRERHARLVEQMQVQGVDVLLAAGPSTVGYATGAVAPAADAGRAAHRRVIAIVTADGTTPDVFTPYPDGVPSGYDREHVHGPFDLEWDDDARTLAQSLPGGRLAVDDCTMPLRAALNGRELVDAGGVVSAAKVIKTADEIECIRRAQAINEAAIGDVLSLVQPGIKATELSGRLLRSLFELGASSNTVDPIWQVMERDPTDRPMSITGDLVFPTPTQARVLAESDLVWVDNGVNYCGYQSDYGNAWIVGREPNAREREHFAVWRALLDRVLSALRPGATCADLTAQAGEAFGRRPWLAHLYLAHGTGIESAELPYVGTDLGADFDASFVLAPGMVLVFEPITWENGVGGFRAEEIVAVTDDGYELLSHVDTSAWS